MDLPSAECGQFGGTRRAQVPCNDFRGCNMADEDCELYGDTQTVGYGNDAKVCGKCNG